MNVLSRYFSVFLDQHTYRNLLYLFLSFPIGLAYFLFLVIGFSLGTGLLVIGVGVLILIAMVFASVGILSFERQLTNRLLDTNIPPADLQAPPGSGIWDRLKYAFKDGVIIKGMMYMFMRFPFGIMGLVVGILSLALPFGLVFAPVSYLAGAEFGPDAVTFGEALFFSLMGLIIGPGILHMMNFIVNLWRDVAVSMLTGNNVPQDLSHRAKRNFVEIPQEKPKRIAEEYIPEKPKNKRSIADLVEEALKDDQQRH